MKQLQGLYPALLTPFDAAGAVNHTVLRELLDLNLSKGVQGFYACGSTAEAFLLDAATRMALLETVMSHVAGRAAVIAQIGTLSTQEAVLLARHAQECGAQAVSSVAPFYYKYTFEEIRQYYFDIADAVDLPVILYNFPAFSGVTFTAENIRVFLDDPRFIGVKHTSNDFFMLERMHSAYPDKVFFNGYDEMFLSGLAAGADGGIGSTYNIMAERYLAIQSSFQQGKIAEAREEQGRVNGVITALAAVGVIPGLKAVLTMMGLDFGPPRRPFLPVEGEALALLRGAWDKLRRG